MAALPAPRIVFTGAIVATKLDIPLLVGARARCGRRGRSRWSARSARANPHADVSALAAEPNIHLLGPRAYGELPDVLRAADAGLIPYARNELTESIFPMKVYEYLAAGLPVVATPLPALAGVADVATAPDAAGHRRAARRGARRATARERRAERSPRGHGHSWEPAPGGDRRRDRRAL